MNDNRPSKKQMELLQFIENFIKSTGYGPSYREIMSSLQYKSVSTVAVHVDGLITRGYLIKKDRSARSIEIVGKSNEFTDSGEKSINETHLQWLLSMTNERLEELVKGSNNLSTADVTSLVEAVRILGGNKDYEILRDRLDSYLNKQ